jgi:membrane protease YdiL (CAAX protease family)
VAATAWAAALGADFADLGLEPNRAVAGLRLGAVHGGAVLIALSIAAFVPPLEMAFEDPRVIEARPRDVLRWAALEIPLATAVYEELVFRSAILGLALRVLPQPTAVAVSSALFGLWHILPALEDRKRNHLIGQHPMVATVAPSVVGTALAGALFARHRLKAGSVVAPLVVHLATNVGALLAATVVVRRRRRRASHPHVGAGPKRAP